MYRFLAGCITNIRHWTSAPLPVFYCCKYKALHCRKATALCCINNHTIPFHPGTHLCVSCGCLNCTDHKNQRKPVNPMLFLLLTVNLWNNREFSLHVEISSRRKSSEVLIKDNTFFSLLFHFPVLTFVLRASHGYKLQRVFFRLKKSSQNILCERNMRSFSVFLRGWTSLPAKHFQIFLLIARVEGGRMGSPGHASSFVLQESLPSPPHWLSSC